jgi:hypothetical protein
MAGKEIKIEVMEQIKIIAKQLENLRRQHEEDQVLLAGMVQRLTALEQRLSALPPPPDSTDAAATHDATSMPLANSTSGAPFSSGGIAITANGGPLATGQIGHLHHYAISFLPSANNKQSSLFAHPPYSTNPTPNPSPILHPTYQQLLQLTPSPEGLQPEAVEVEKLGGAEVVPSPAAGSELVKKRHVLLHPQREEVVFSTPRSWRYTSSMWGYLGRQPWPPPEQLEDELLVKGSVVLCVGI